jgi:hypothetical protein
MRCWSLKESTTIRILSSSKRDGSLTDLATKPEQHKLHLQLSSSLINAKDQIVNGSAAKRLFEDALDRADNLASTALARAPEDENALLASVLRVGLQADYLSLIEKRNLAALSEVKQSRIIAQHLFLMCGHNRRRQKDDVCWTDRT